MFLFKLINTATCSQGFEAYCKSVEYDREDSDEVNILHIYNLYMISSKKLIYLLLAYGFFGVIVAIRGYNCLIGVGCGGRWCSHEVARMTFYRCFIWTRRFIILVGLVVLLIVFVYNFIFGLFVSYSNGDMYKFSIIVI